jgi:hypothetical protein
MKKHSIARAAVTAGLTIAMSLGGALGPATMAFADTAANSTITINNINGNKTNFKGYQIFTADVADTDSGKVASNLEWASEQVKTDVQTATKQTFATAQDAADYLAKLTTSGSGYILANGDVLNAIANELMNDKSLTQKTVTGGTASDTLESGYWLFVTDPDSVDVGSDTTSGETYTAPIFTVIGGKTVTVTEKTSIPTVEKKIVSDADGAEHDAADSHVGQDVTYNIYGTVAQDFATYDSYSYAFTDNVSEGLTVDSSSVKVYMYSNKYAAKADLSHTTGTEVTSHFTIGLGQEKTDKSKDLTVTAKDAKGLKSIEGATKDSCFVVTYTAKINSSAVIGNAGNPNTVKLTYSNNPNAEGTGETVPDTVRDFTYALNLVKLDQGTEKALSGATFTIKVKTADDKASEGKYVKADGTLTSSKDDATLTTGTDGKINVKGLDNGTYTVTEESAPNGYTKVDPFVFTITPTIDETNQSVTLKSELTTSDPKHVVAGLTDGTAGDNTLNVTNGSGVTDNKTVNITVGDVKSVGLPLTGQAGIGVTLAAGGAVLALGVYRVVRSRREQDAE